MPLAHCPLAIPCHQALACLWLTISESHQVCTSFQVLPQRAAGARSARTVIGTKQAGLVIWKLLVEHDHLPFLANRNKSAGGTNGQQTPSPKILIDWSTGGNRLKMERNIFEASKQQIPKGSRTWIWCAVTRMAICEAHPWKCNLCHSPNLPPTKNCTSNISHSGTIFAISLRVTRTWTHTHIIPSPHTEKMLRKPSLDARNLFLFGSFWVPFFVGWLYIYICIHILHYHHESWRYRDRIGTTHPTAQAQLKQSVVSVQLQGVRDLLFSHGRVVRGRHQGRIDDGRADGEGESNGKGCIDLKTKVTKGS